MERLAAAAHHLLANASSEHRRRLHLRLDDAEARHDWHYVPRSHPGVALEEMPPAERVAARDLLAATLAPHAFAQAGAIMALEDVLDVTEGGAGRRRSGGYAVSVFGDPAPDGTWGWRLEGHHLAVNVTVARGTVSTTPLFMGAHPARVAHAGRDVSRPLCPEEELARTLITALTGKARRRATVDEQAPTDIRTGNAARVHADLAAGVCRDELDLGTSELLTQLAALYRARAHPGLHDPGQDGGALTFAWAGSLEPGEPHYYRLQSPSLLVEYANTQNGANHVHSVWRDPHRDFGGDLLPSA